jgi:hypothetical protein
MRALAARFENYVIPLCVIFLLALAPRILAQSGASSIQGTVSDPSGGALPGAVVNVTNVATGVLSSTQTNGVGYFTVPALFTGDYKVTVTAPQMKTYGFRIHLSVDQHAVINPALEIGVVSQQVEVSGQMVQLVTPDGPTISSTLENERINQLPMNGRQLLNLTGQTTPGLDVSGTRPNGLEAEAMEYVADGVPMINRNFGGVGNSPQAQLPDPDSVQEVKTETANSGAQFSTPATVVITTKSGTNTLHGSLFETARNNAFGVAKRRQDPYNFAAPHLVRNEFGVSLGGPIVIPGLYNGKNRSFWFFAFERYSLAQVSNQLDTVPTVAMRQGDWSGLYNSAGTFQQLYDPNTTAASSNCNATGTANLYCRAPFANNQIPLSRMSPTAKIIFDITPLPTNNANPLVSSNLTAQNPSYTVVPTVTFRLDHNFSQSDHAFLRFQSNVQNNSALRDNPINEASIAADGLPAGASGFAQTLINTYAGSLGFTHIFSPTFFSETVVSQEWFHQNTIGGGHPELNYEQMLGLPNNFGATGFPDIDPSGFANLFGTQWNYDEAQIITNIDENLSKTLGKHLLQFGGRYRHERFGYLPDRTHDTISFNGQATALENPASGANYAATTNTGNTDADLYLGAASSYQLNLNAPYLHFHDMEFDAYFADMYHITKRITATLGLRYEAHPAGWMKHGLAMGFDLKNDAIILAQDPSYYIDNGFSTQAIFTNLSKIGAKIETPAQANVPSTIIKNYDAIFAPRLGIAYQLFSGKYQTIVRGGFGRYLYPIPVRSALVNAAKNVPFIASYTESYTAANQSPDRLPNYLLRSKQAVLMGVNSSNVVDTTSTTSILPGQALVTLDPDYAPDSVTTSNFTIEQSMKGNSALRVSWVYTRGANLDHYYYYNNHPSAYVWEMQTGTVPPTGSVIGSNTYAATATGPYDQTTWGSNVMDEKNGWSNYNALQVNYQRLFHNGVAYQLSSVWAKAFRMGGNWSRDSGVYPSASYVGNSGTTGIMTSPYGTVINPTLPPGRPAGVAPWQEYHALDVFEDYSLDSAIPKLHINFNGIVDLPFGRGKRYLGTVNRLVDALVGGFQIAGSGSIVSQRFQVTATNWGPTNPLKVYKHRVPVTDCRSGVCNKAFQWFNGYLAPTVVSGNPCATTGTVVSGLPAEWAPYQSPIDTNCNKADPANKYYNSNEVNIQLANGSVVPQVFSPGPTGANPYSHTFIDGPINYSADISLFKVFSITERVKLRLNVDAFNAFNIQGYTNPNATDGIEQVQAGVGVATSYNTPRQLQLSARLSF